MPRKDYKAKLESDSRAAAVKSQAGRDVSADYPKKGNLKRRKACERNLRLYLETYHKPAFYLGWSRDHLSVIDRLQECCLHGGLFSLAMPRGAGKTALT